MRTWLETKLKETFFARVPQFNGLTPSIEAFFFTWLLGYTVRVGNTNARERANYGGSGWVPRGQQAHCGAGPERGRGRCTSIALRRGAAGRRGEAGRHGRRRAVEEEAEGLGHLAMLAGFRAGDFFRKNTAADSWSILILRSSTCAIPRSMTTKFGVAGSRLRNDDEAGLRAGFVVRDTERSVTELTN